MCIYFTVLEPESPKSGAILGLQLETSCVATWQSRDKTKSCLQEGTRARVASICNYLLSWELLRVLEAHYFLLRAGLLTSFPAGGPFPFRAPLSIATLGSKAQHRNSWKLHSNHNTWKFTEKLKTWPLFPRPLCELIKSSFHRLPTESAHLGLAFHQVKLPHLMSATFQSQSARDRPLKELLCACLQKLLVQASVNRYCCSGNNKLK